jgi:hypothetical protein
MEFFRVVKTGICDYNIFTIHNMKQTPPLKVAETLVSLWQVHVPQARNYTN